MVYFVGAGSGAPDLITLRGARLLEKADCVIYAGSLVNKELVSTHVGGNVRLHNSAQMTLEEVISVIEDEEKKGHVTVRLHSGEPSLYGAVREQMDELEKKGIAYESCPGVTACFAAAASLNIEYTLPEVSQTLIITRLKGRTPVPETERIEELSKHKASMAVYLSTGMTGELVKRLLAGGYDKDTPAAIVYRASWEDEKSLVCTLGTLEEEAEKNGIRNQAVILVGEAVGHQKFSRSKLYDPEFDTGFRNGLHNTNTDQAKN